MTVTGRFGYNIRPFSGYSDPGLPIGSYIAQGGLAGNASGGQVVFNFTFQDEQPNLITEMFNLEQVAIDTDAFAIDDVLMTTVNMDSLSRNRPASDQRWSLSTNPTPASDSAVPMHETAGLPLWLGSPNLSSLSGTATLRFFFVNVDLRLYAVTIQGYIWGPRSVLADGGPRRPVGGLFRA